MTIDIRVNNPHPQRPDGKVDTLQDLNKAIHGCWQFPQVDEGRQPVDAIFQVSFKRSGELFGKPRVVKFSREVSPQERERFYLAVVEAIDRCSPMPSRGSISVGRAANDSSSSPSRITTVGIWRLAPTGSFISASVMVGLAAIRPIVPRIRPSYSARCSASTSTFRMAI